MKGYTKDGLFHMDADHVWHRLDRVQEYKGITILTETVYQDDRPERKQREYVLIWEDGRISRHQINKRGGNISDLRYMIDNRSLFL